MRDITKQLIVGYPPHFTLYLVSGNAATAIVDHVATTAPPIRTLGPLTRLIIGRGSVLRLADLIADPNPRVSACAQRLANLRIRLLASCIDVGDSRELYYDIRLHTIRAISLNSQVTLGFDCATTLHLRGALGSPYDAATHVNIPGWLHNAPLPPYLPPGYPEPHTYYSTLILSPGHCLGNADTTVLDAIANTACNPLHATQYFTSADCPNPIPVTTITYSPLINYAMVRRPIPSASPTQCYFNEVSVALRLLIRLLQYQLYGEPPITKTVASISSMWGAKSASYLANKLTCTIEEI